MHGKIKVIKGTIGSLKISNSTFVLKRITENNGKASAIVDASELLGKEYNNAVIQLEDYKIITGVI
jgi:hypothetical protein